MKNKILRNMSVLLLGMLFAVYAVFGYAMYRQNVNAVQEQLVQESEYAAKAIEESGQKALESLASMTSGRNQRITLIDREGMVLYDSNSLAGQMENHAERPEIKQARASGCGRAERYSDTLQEKTFYYAILLKNGQVLRLATATASVYGTWKSQLSLLTLMAGVLFAISMAVADHLAYRIVNPINDLDLQHPLQITGYDELSPLLLRLDRQNKQIEEQIENLQARQAEFDAITENMQEGLILLNSQFRVLSINESAKRILGVEFDPVMEREELPPHILKMNRSQELLRAVQAAQTGETGHCMIEQDGRQYSLLASPVVRSEKNGGVVIFLLDVTEQLEAERIRKEFSANVSHELKTPLTSISGYAEIIENGMVKPGDIPCFAGRIHKEALRLINLIEDIIQLSRLDEDAVTWPKEPVELKSLCREVAGRLASQAQERNVTVNVTGQEATVMGVRRLLDEMVTNLCENAIKYNKVGGQAEIAVQKKNGVIRVSVADTGIGIPAEHHSRIFERFYRVDKSHSRETGGTGLGLSIVKHAAAVHGAQIQLESEVGKGTKITVIF